MQEIATGRHEYRMRGWQRGIYLLLGLFLCGIGAIAAWAIAQQPNQDGAALFGILPLAIGIYLLALVLRSRLVIDGTRIEVRGAFREKSAEVGDVEGFRTITTRNGSFWKLQSKEGRGSVTIQKWFDCDDLRAWFQQLTDFDERDRKALLDEIEHDQQLGATPEERLRALKQAKQWNIALSVVAIAAAIAALIPNTGWQGPVAVILALVPAAALYLLNRNPLLYVLGKSKRDPRTELSIALLASGFGLFASGMRTDFVSFMPLLPSIFMVAAAFLFGFYAFGRKGPRTQGFHVLVIMCAGFYSFGLIAACNTLPDHAKSTDYSAQVIHKHSVSGKSTTYYLDFDPWGPFSGANKVSVPSSVYQRTTPGDAACFEVHPGALKAAWFQRVACEAPQARQVIVE
jgi:hypothetical protein